MPRKQRELVDEGIYHVFNRGNDRQHLFLEEQDYKYFLEQLLTAKKRLQATIYHYCLMSNHFHLLVRVVKGQDLPRMMHFTQLGYARYFKKKYHSVGHVFQERFRSPRIPEESYYLQCGRYIERNPVKARLCQKAEDYRWTSARYYVNSIFDPLVTPNMYYEQMGSTPKERQESYRRFVSIDEPYGHIVEEALLRV